MDDFNEKFSAALQQAGISVISDTGEKMSREAITKMFNDHTVYEVAGKWYTRDSIFSGDQMDEPFNSLYKENSILADELSFYMLNDCWVSGLCIVLFDGKYGIFPLERRTGDQSGIWSCKGDPFLYDEVKVYADWQAWDDYGFVAARKGSGWGVLKITQFPDPLPPEQVADFKYSSPEDAMKAAGITKLPEDEPYKNTLSFN